ncbi:Uncharacterised protein [Mycobacterium tuberculosis]|nr:Uncharacterised protein [Mycobacterium tuberculosis]
MKAKNNDLLSQKTAVEYSPLTKNSDDEIIQINKEKAEKVELEMKIKKPNENLE